MSRKRQSKSGSKPKNKRVRNRRRGESLQSLKDFVDGRVRDELEETSQPPTVYHYTSKENLFSILRSRSIWATYYRHIGDDDEELEHADQDALAIAKEMLPSSGEDAARVLQSFIENYHSWRISALPDPKIYVACFCRRDDDAHLWRKFGRGGFGCCLGLRVLDEEHDIPCVGQWTISVEYSSKERRGRLGASFRDILEHLAAFQGNAPDRAIRIVLSGLYRVAASMNVRSKSAQYSQEDEWRLLVWPWPKHALEVHGSCPERVVYPLRAGGNLPDIACVRFGRELPDSVEGEIRAVLEEAGYGGGGALPRVERAQC